VSATDNPGAEALPASYEDARVELADIVRRLESGAQTLEESLALWERGEALAVLCQKWLDGARARLDGTPADGNPSDGNPADGNPADDDAG
jgi:exodeoxyribonuclease VII small subunit